MPVVGLSLKSIDARRLDDYVGPVKIKNNTNLSNVKATKLPGLGKEGINIEFNYKTEYQTKADKTFALIEIIGDVLFIDKNGEVMKMWKDSKKLPDDVNIEVLNVILRKSVTKALTLAEDVQLPAPINLPIARPPEKK